MFDRLLTFDYSIEHIPGAEIRQLDFILANQNKKQNLQTNMTKNLQLQQLPAFMTQLQHFIKFLHHQNVNHSTLTR